MLNKCVKNGRLWTASPECAHAVERAVVPICQQHCLYERGLIPPNLMVDEEQYRRTRQQILRLPCPYEKAIVSRVCGCAEATKTNLAEREVVSCRAQECQQACLEVLEHIRQRANFALGLTHTSGELPHAKAVKIQCGGLLGLQEALDPDDAQPRICNIFSLIRRAKKHYGAFDGLPFPQIMRAVVRYEHRRRRRRS